MMTNEFVPPAVILIAGGLVLPLLKGGLRTTALLVLPLVTLWLVWQVPDGIALKTAFIGHDLVLVKGDKLSRLFAMVFAIMAFAGALFALNQSRTTELAAAFIYAGSAIGVCLAGDLISVFVFWELMAVASCLVVWSSGPGARGAGLRYAVIHMLSGVLLMAGIAGEISAAGSIAFAKMDLNTVPRCLILAGFLINAGATPLSAWLPDAYPEASWSGMVFLSAFTTKTAVYVLLRGFPGAELLIWIGLAMVFYGIIYAILENDMRRILAYSIVNQVGFMVAGIGIGTEMALNGAASHAFTHIIYKALLLMSAGSVLYMTGKRKCTDLGGLFRTMPVTTLCGIIGALSISSFPLTSGFISKSMIARWLTALLFGIGDVAGLLGWRPPVRTNARREMARGAIGDPGPWMLLTGLVPRPLSAALATEPAGVQERWFAALYFLKPLILLVLSAFWIITGLLSLGPGYDIGVGLMQDGGAGRLSGPVVVAGAFADILIGAGIAWRRTAHAALWAAVGLSLFYAVAGSLLLPRLWIEPLGPLLKIWPIVLLTLVALAVLRDR